VLQNSTICGFFRAGADSLVRRYDASVKTHALLFLFVASLSAQSVSVWLTTDDHQSLLQPQAAVSFAPVGSPAIPAVFVDDLRIYQAMEGFGASFTDSSAWLMKEKIPPAALPGVMTSLFDHASGIGISFVRNPMGSSDLTRPPDYSYDDQPAGVADPNLDHFSIAHDEADIIPLLLQARAINPHLKIMANPWSPPGWMKTSGSMIGGSLLPAQYNAFTNYFVRFLKGYADDGVPVDYISLQNEPLLTPADYPGMLMLATEQLVLLRDHVLPALAANQIDTKVLIYDHNWDQPSYPQTVLADSTLINSPQIGGIAWHWYGGNPGAMSLLHNQYPQRNAYLTEASDGTWIPDETKNDFELTIQSMRNWASAFVKWGIALDENRGPHTGGCGTCTPLITVNESTGAVSYDADYYTLGHFSKFVLPGARRIYSSNAPGIVTAAFRNPDGAEVVVAYNDSAISRQFQVNARGQSFVYTLPSLAGATFVWTPAQPGSRGRYGVQPAAIIGHPGRPAWMVNVAAQPQIQASSYTNMLGVETETCTDADGGFDLGYIADGSWAEYSNLDFGQGVSSVSVRSASGGSGGTVEFHLDAVDGQLIGAATLPVTGNWQGWTTTTATITGAHGLHNLFIVFHAAGSSGIANLNWFKFQ